MTKLTLHLMETDYQRLEKAAQRAEKSVQAFIYEWILQLPAEEAYDVTQDALFHIAGYESNAPTDLSIHLDQYLYGGKYPK
jgi:hypothetical protein